MLPPRDAAALLERMADPRLLTAFLPLLCTLGGGAEYAHGVRDHFAPMVDVILAWTLAPTADPALASAISTNFAELGHAWAGAANFGAGLLGSLTADAERTLAACAPSDGGGGGDVAGIDRAHRILGVISAVLAGLGPASFGALPDASALAARSIAGSTKPERGGHSCSVAIESCPHDHCWHSWKNAAQVPATMRLTQSTPRASHVSRNTSPQASTQPPPLGS